METINNLKNGNYFKLKETGKTVYIKGAYNRSFKKFECCKFNDINDYRLIKTNTLVFIDFEF